MVETGVVKRAFELAISGINGFNEIRKLLKKEGFTESTIEQHLGGAGIRRELREAYKGAQVQVEKADV